MTTPAVRALRRRYPEAHIRYVTMAPDLLIHNPDIDELSPVHGTCDRQVRFEYPVKNGYPHVPLQRHLALEFADCGGVTVDDIRGTLRFLPDERRFVENIVRRFKSVVTATIHVKAGWSPYKEWPLENWQRVVDHFFRRIAFVQIGANNEPVLANVVSMVGIMNVRLAAACIQATDLSVGIDSFPNHVAGALGKPAVVIFGSTSPVGSGYPTAINLWSQEPCSPCYREYNSISRHPQGPCPYAVRCQAGITVDQVVQAIETLLVDLSRRQAA
jgi:ADP-heptose:LPS heptosyltransferase